MWLYQPRVEAFGRLHVSKVKISLCIIIDWSVSSLPVKLKTLTQNMCLSRFVMERYVLFLDIRLWLGSIRPPANILTGRNVLFQWHYLQDQADQRHVG